MRTEALSSLACPDGRTPEGHRRGCRSRLAAVRRAADAIRIGRRRALEAQERVGGRCWSAHGWADGQVGGEHGGELIEPGQARVLALAGELGLTLESREAGRRDVRLVRHGVGRKPRRLEGLGGQLGQRPVDGRVVRSLRAGSPRPLRRLDGPAEGHHALCRGTHGSFDHGLPRRCSRQR